MQVQGEGAGSALDVLLQGVRAQHLKQRMDQWFEGTEFANVVNLCSQAHFRKVRRAVLAREKQAQQGTTWEGEKWSSLQLKILVFVASIVSYKNSVPHLNLMSPADWEIPASFLFLSPFLCWRRVGQGLQQKHKVEWDFNQDGFLQDAVGRCTQKLDWTRITSDYNLTAYKNSRMYRNSLSCNYRYQQLLQGRHQSGGRLSPLISPFVSSRPKQPRIPPRLTAPTSIQKVETQGRLILTETDQEPQSKRDWTYALVHPQRHQLFFIQKSPRINLSILTVHQTLRPFLKMLKSQNQPSDGFRVPLPLNRQPTFKPSLPKIQQKDPLSQTDIIQGTCPQEKTKSESVLASAAQVQQPGQYEVAAQHYEMVQEQSFFLQDNQANSLSPQLSVEKREEIDLENSTEQRFF